jgi:hypothetical protein
MHLVPVPFKETSAPGLEQRIPSEDRFLRGSPHVTDEVADRVLGMTRCCKTFDTDVLSDLEFIFILDVMGEGWNLSRATIYGSVRIFGDLHTLSILASDRIRISSRKPVEDGINYGDGCCKRKNKLRSHQNDHCGDGW